jgi:hypothetical protein
LPEVKTKPKKRKKTLPEEKLRELGRKHFAEDFPNPERKGCPPSDQLQFLAENARSAKEWVLDHISHCSPCYRDYSAFLKVKKKKARAKSASGD